MATLTRPRTNRKTRENIEPRTLAYHFPQHRTGTCAGCDAQAAKESQLNGMKARRR